ncbi:hypothetical protein [Nostoc sp. DSM 114160]
MELASLQEYNRHLAKVGKRVRGKGERNNKKHESLFPLLAKVTNAKMLIRLLGICREKGKGEGGKVLQKSLSPLTFTLFPKSAKSTFAKMLIVKSRSQRYHRQH